MFPSKKGEGFKLIQRELEEQQGKSSEGGGAKGGASNQGEVVTR